MMMVAGNTVVVEHSVGRQRRPSKADDAGGGGGCGLQLILHGGLQSVGVVHVNGIVNE